MMRVGIAADHGGFTLKGQVAELLRGSGYEVVDFGAHQLDPEDDYPDFIIPLARAVAAGKLSATWRSAAAVRAKLPVRVPRSFMMYSPPIKASKMTN